MEKADRLNSQLDDLGEGDDIPDEILTESGKDVLVKYLNTVVDKTEFLFKYYSSNKSLNTFEEKNKFISDFIPVLVRSKNKLEVENYILNLSRLTGFDASTIRDVYKDAVNKNKKNEKLDFKDFVVETKALRRYVLAEREILFQMFSNKDAIVYFENNIEYFYDEIYQKIANYIIELYETSGKVDMNLLISLFDQSEDESNSILRDKVTELLLERHHPPFSMELMIDCKSALDNEQEKYKNRVELDKAIQGKDPMEQARLIDEYLKAKN